MKLSELRPGMENIDLYVKLLSLEEPRVVTTNLGLTHTLVEGVISDETDKIGLTVWNDKIGELVHVKVGDDIELTKCFISSFKGDLSVNVGRDSSIQSVT